MPGAILAQRYRIAGRLGRGGMGEVYRAYDLILGQDVALKFLPRDFTSNPAALDRFRNEVRLARQVSHPNVCRVYDIGEIEDAPFLSMEYVDGEDLASLLRRIGHLPADKALDIARRLCAGVSAAHEKGVLHRDLKPANVMIDGRGEVLITDFGLAAMAGSVDETAVRQGTPAYQAPEQLAGREVTVKSDLYGLGLVLYEMFTGRRAFEARSVEDLARVQRESTPVSVTSLARDVDPAVERAILRCLAPDPHQRPASARAVAASLPGGDPLAAAMAAGETPSPEMVAQAGETEGFAPTLGILLLTVTMAGLVAVAALQGRYRFPERTPFENSPEALTTMARDVAKRFGYPQRPADTAFGLQVSSAYLRYAQSHYPMERIRAQMAAARPAPVTYWYRESPVAMDPHDQNWVTPEAPGFSVAGMLRLRLDMEGRLLEFEARPPEQGIAAAEPPDWKTFFEAAKLDPARFGPAPPEWTPVMATDAVIAWTGTFPEAPEVPIRVEAAAWRGKPVSFRILGPWTRPASDAAANPSRWRRVFLVVLPYFIFFPAGILLARRNLRLKRGDLAGAIRLAVAAFAIDILSDCISMHYFWAESLERKLFVLGSIDITQSVFLGVAYLAIEPYVRRRCPRILISWARLLQSGPRDPVVGVAILAGIAAGVVSSVLVTGLGILHVESMHNIHGLISSTSAVNGPRYFLGALLGYAWSALFAATIAVFMFFVMHVFLRRDWMAAAAVVLVLTAFLLSGAETWTVDLPFGIVFYSIGVVVLLRFGLTGLVALISVLNWTADLLPLTLDPSRWYFGYVLTDLLVITAAAVWAFRVSLGGRTLLKDESLG